MCEKEHENEKEPFDGFRKIETLNDTDAGLFKFVMTLSGDAPGVGNLTDAQKIQRIEQRLQQDAEE
jgi:hypothetical protein